MSAWRTALRIAGREARRAKGRTALVLVLITLPVLALAFAAVTYDMFDLTPRERINRDVGTAQARIIWEQRAPMTQDLGGTTWNTAEERAAGEPVAEEPTPGGEEPQPFRATPADVLAHLPPGSRVIPLTDGWLELRTAAGTGQMSATGIDLDDPLVAGMFTLLDGRTPRELDETALSARAMERLGTHLGGTFQNADRSRTYRVVGLVEKTADLGEVIVQPPQVPGPDGLPYLPSWLVDTPDGITWDAVRRLNAEGMIVRSRAVVLDPPADPEGALETGSGRIGAQDLAMAVVVGGLALFEVVLLAGPAFAIGARRRRRDLALVAANGGTPAHLRRIVLSDGIVLGLAGAVIGVVGGIAVAFAARPLVETYLAGWRAGGYRVFPFALLAVAALAVLTGTVAALVPAFTAARQDVVAALTGRRGAVRSRRRWVLLGLLLGAGGVALGLVGAVSGEELAILGGIVLAELGLVLVTPALVGLIALAGRSLPLGPRIALRDTARNRAAAAPAISAVMAAVAGCVAMGVFLASDTDRQDAQYEPGLPLGYASIAVMGNRLPDGSGAADLPRAGEVAAAARGSFAVTGVVEVNAVDCAVGSPADRYCGIGTRLPAERVCPYDDDPWPLPAAVRDQALADPRCARPASIFATVTFGTVVDDGTALATMSGAPDDEVRAARAVLAEGGVVVSDERYVKDGRVTVADEGTDPPRTFEVPGYALRGAVSSLVTYVSPAVVEKLGMRAVPAGFVVATAEEPDQADEDRFNAALAELGGRYYLSVEHGSPFDNDLEALGLGLVAAVIALGATAVATGLAAADSRADLATLAAIGAAPRVRRVLTLSQSGVIAGLGSLLGTAAGLAAGFTVLTALNRRMEGTWPTEVAYPLVVPVTVLLVLVAIPVVAMLGAGLLTRARLPIERRLG